MLVLVAPGQGAQTPGFLTPWLELPGAADRLGAWSDAIGLDLAHYGTQADADAIRDTAVAQPLLVAAGLLSAAALGDIVPGAVAGHSVGEITAAAYAGVLDDTAALTLVRKRGLAMAEAAAITETGMSALLGGDPEVSVAHLEKLGLTPANMNGAGQIVAAGTMEQLAALNEDKPEGVRKVVQLKVAGAVVVGPSQEPAIGPTVWGSEGDKSETIKQTVPWNEYDSSTDKFPAITQEGQAVFRWAVFEMAKVAQQALDAAGISPDDLDVFIPHQANERIIDSMVKTLKLPEHVTVARDVRTTGNTSAASIPLAMERLLATGEAKSGDTALVIGFGAGLVYAATVVTLP